MNLLQQNQKKKIVPQKRILLPKNKNRKSKHVFALVQQNTRVNTRNNIQVDKQVEQINILLDQTNIINGQFDCGKTTLLKHYFEFHKNNQHYMVGCQMIIALQNDIIEDQYALLMEQLDLKYLNQQNTDILK